MAMLLALATWGCSTIPQANANVAFMGDSITASWWLPRSNLGVYGNTTTQMLARFHDQISGHGYKAVIILGGTNDVRKAQIPIDQVIGTAIANLIAMASDAESQGSEVVLCILPPMNVYGSRVEALNEAIRAVAQQHDYKLIDYYTPMAGHPEYFRDGEHPNEEGYFVMQQALVKVLPLDY